MAESNPNKEDFIKQFGVPSQLFLCQDYRQCILGDYPTFGDLDDCFNSNVSVELIMAHLVNLNEHEGCKGKITKQQLMETACIIAISFSELKISEFILYCFMFKSGRFGRFYGSVDPGIIVEKLNYFVEEVCNPVLEKEYRDKISEEYIRSVNDGITWNEYCSATGKCCQSPLQRFASRIISRHHLFNEESMDDDKRCSIIRESAMTIVENKYGYDAETLKKAESSFLQKYGMTPSEYIKKGGIV